MGYELQDQEFESRLRQGIFLQIVQTDYRARRASSTKGTGIPFPGIERPRRDFENSPLSRAEVKEEEGYTLTTPMCLHGVDTDKFTVYAY
jgi:hypothetical protein